ncbi:MBL fold metallo-hydrolase [Falsiroseomonas ponticola]|uniref:MBL fold metallo-hydrolase n=1 Tax=Falsiroseomonas ponticola TaxID=2786951 RepID=UPI0019312D99|nr:MBL fold metallo-hydrolase [Roseomonas ponticola]
MIATQVPGVFHRRVGEILVTALHDGHQDAPVSSMDGIGAEEATALLAASFRPARRTAVNAFLIRHGSRIALVDAGLGQGVRPTVGFVAQHLAEAGVAAAAVDTLLMTHLHRDHWGGIADSAGNAAFPNATLHVHADELAHWDSDEAMMRLPDPAQRQAMFIETRNRLRPYRDRMAPFTQGEVFPGVTAIPLPGHTPGHTGFMVSSQGKSLLIWGDIVHVPEVQIARPEVTMKVDTDPALAIATRRRILDQVATDRLAIAGMHLHFPAFAHVAREGSGYRLVPDAWTLDLDGDTP